MTAELAAGLSARQKQYNYYRDKLILSAEGAEETLLGDIAIIGTGSMTPRTLWRTESTFLCAGRGASSSEIPFSFDEAAIITAGDGVGVGKVFHFATGQYALHQRAYRIVPKEGVDARFGYHYLFSDFLVTLSARPYASVTSLRRPMFLKYPILLPSLEEQRRIVAILDKFDTLTSSITDGLPREIELRQKQYEYYRDMLLSFRSPKRLRCDMGRR